jgi:hypothetical protein
LIFARKNAVKCELCGERALLRRLVEKVHPEKGINATLVHFAINFDEIVKKKKNRRKCARALFCGAGAHFCGLAHFRKKKKKKKKKERKEKYFSAKKDKRLNQL